MYSDLANTPDWSHPYRGPSHLFLLRVWLDESSENDLRGRVQHTVTGETHYFRTCAELRRIIRDRWRQKNQIYSLSTRKRSTQMTMKGVLHE